MNGTTKRRVGFGALTGLVIAGVIGVNAMNVSGQVVTDADPYPDVVVPYGSLTVNLTDRGGSLTLLRGTDTITQAIRTTQPCAKVILDPIQVNGVAISDTTATLLDFESLVGNPANGSLALAGTVQIPSTLLGVESGTNCGTPSGQLGPNEALKLTLGTFEDLDEGVSVQSGTLKIGKTNTQDKELQIARDKDTYVAADFTAAPSIPVGGANVPSGAFDDSITLRSTATSNSRGLSLKGGTTFNLVVATEGEYEYAVECGETVADDGGEGDIASSATFYRAYDEAKGSNKCTDEVGITVQILPEYVYWNNATVGVNNVAEAVAGLVTVNWAPIPTSLGPTEVQARLAREIDYDAGVENFVDVQWCLSFVENAPIGGVRSFTVDMPPTVGPSSTDVPWCLASDSQQLVGGNILQTQEYYGAGDPYNR